MIKLKLKSKEYAWKRCITFSLLILGICIAPHVMAESNEVVEVQQNQTITGTVKDTDGESLIGVSILVPKTSIGAITDINGNYSLSVPSNASSLQFSYVGHETQTVSIRGKSRVDVTLQLSALAIKGEVVVVGYGSQKKETVTGAVSSITTKDLLQSPTANISNALAGRLPGLIAVQRSGMPGQDQSTLRIRGIGTFADKPENGKDPRDPLVMVDGIESDNFNNIDPSEIESVTILKDASATAVYGVRGANGVVLITTRRGLSGKPQVNFTMNTAVTNFPFLRKGMNSYDYALSYERAKQNDAYTGGAYTPKFTAEEIQKYKDGSDPIFYPSMDWVDYLLADYGYQTQSNFNVRGGTDRVKYFMSLGYFTQEGMFNTSHFDPGYDYQARYKRYNMRSNFDIDLTSNLKASFDISAQVGDMRNPNWSIGGLMASLTSAIPMASPGAIDNKLIVIPQGGNPLTPFSKGFNRETQNDLNGSLRLTHTMDYLLQGLSLRGAVSYKNFSSEKKTYTQHGIVDYAPVRLADGTIDFREKGTATAMQFGWDIGKHTRIYMEGGLDFSRAFGDHAVTGLLLYNQQKYYDPNLQYLVANGVQGLVGRVTYNYKSRYMAEFNIGYNGTENFAKGKRFGTFPAYSLGWIPSEEAFFPQNDYVTFVKFRGSYGEVGNDVFGKERFLYLPTTYAYEDVGYFFGPASGMNDGPKYKSAVEGKLGNPLLTWERKKAKNIGADLKFWKDKIGLTIDFFHEKREDILAQRTTPTIIGSDMPAYNLGIMKNSGWDGEISYNDKVGDVNYYVRANYTLAKNVVEYKDEVKRNYAYSQTTGHRYQQIFGYVADGLFNTWEEVNDVNRPDYTNVGTNRVQPGDIRYVDINGDGRIDQDDQVPIGYSNIPEVTYGISLGASWKNFDVSILFQGSDRVSAIPTRSIRQGFVEDGGANAQLLESWTPERYANGDKITFPRFSSTTNPNYAWSTFWLEDASYVRLKNAELGYTFRQEILKKAGIRAVRVYLNGSNLITWCNLFKGSDPEYPSGPGVDLNGDQYPVTRVFNVGFNINF